MDNNVDSWPPCIVELEVKTVAGFPESAADSQDGVVESIKYFSGDAMFPK